MKRDMDLVRQILLAIEQSPRGFAPGKLTVESFTDEQIGYHVYIMWQAGLVEADDNTGRKGGLRARPRNLTWAGHDFLDAARDKTRWAKAKEIAGKVGGITFEVFKQLLTTILSGQVDKAMQRVSP